MGKFSLPEKRGVELSSLLFEVIPSTEGLGDFVTRLTNKLLAIGGHHVSMVKYISDNKERFSDLNKEKLIRTVMPRDLSCVGNALQEINEDLQKFRNGDRMSNEEICSDTLAKAGITSNGDEISMVDFKHGHWGEGKNRTDIDSPMTFKKTVSEFGWDVGAPVYASRFIELVEAANKAKLIDCLKRHYADIAKVETKGYQQAKVREDHKVVIGQINALMGVRDTLIAFYFKQLNAVLKAANSPVTGAEPAAPEGVYVPDTWTGK